MCWLVTSGNTEEKVIKRERKRAQHSKMLLSYFLLCMEGLQKKKNNTFKKLVFPLIVILVFFCPCSSFFFCDTAVDKTTKIKQYTAGLEY